MNHAKFSKLVEQKRGKKISMSVWIIVTLVIVTWLFFTFYDGGFQFKEEDRLDSLTLWIFAPFLIVASLISLAAKSWGAFVSTVLFCCCLIYPPIEGFILFLNAKIDEPTEELIIRIKRYFIKLTYAANTDGPPLPIFLFWRNSVPT
jgi:hypothetical protein